VINNAIGMVAAGNAVVVAPHPSAARVTLRTVEILNEAIAAAGGPRELITVLGEPSIEATQKLMVHPRVRLVVVTGGPGVVAAAMASGKKVVAAGPGNPPVVVDTTADVRQAAHQIVQGASLDNNIVCSDEKEVIAVHAVADQLLTELARADAVVLDEAGVREVTSLLFTEVRGPRERGVIDRRWIGRDASRILAELGRPADDRVRLLVAPVGADHPLLWTEQLCPVLPLTRAASVGEAMTLAREVEHGYGHTAVMHSRDVTELSRMARLMDTCIFVKNGPAYAGLGYGGEGPTSFTIAHPTGDGLTNARTFSRLRRCVLVDAFRIV
jgi:acyl-CoA reductase-like NAD-dependent aldehyde dehydrogenase